MPGYGYFPDEEEEDPRDFVSLPGYKPEPAPIVAPIDPPPEDTRAQLEALSKPLPPMRPSFSHTEAFDAARKSDNAAQIGSDLSQNIYNAFTGKAVQGRPLASSVGASEKRAAAFDADEENDPTSPSSTMARDTIKRVLPDVAAHMGPQFERASMRYLKQAFPFLKEAMLDVRGKRKAQADAEAAKAKETQRLKERGEDQQLGREKEDRGFANSRSVAEIAAGRRRQEVEDAEARKIEAERRKVASGGGGLKMTAGETSKIADLDVASQIMDDLWGTFGTKAGGALSGAAQWLPATKAKQYNDERRVTAQVVGGILEGGKLTEDDFKRYYEMLPDPADSHERAMAKKEAVSRLLKTRRGIVVKTLGKAGFNTGGLGEDGGSFDLGAKPPSVATPEDFEALPSGAEFVDPQGNKRRKP